MIAPPDNSALYRSAEGYRQVMAFYDASLGMLAVPHWADYVDTCLGPSFVVSCGRREGKPVVLRYGQDANLITWMGQIPPWEQPKLGRPPVAARSVVASAPVNGRQSESPVSHPGRRQACGNGATRLWATGITSPPASAGLAPGMGQASGPAVQPMVSAPSGVHLC